MYHVGGEVIIINNNLALFDMVKDGVNDRVQRYVRREDITGFIVMDNKEVKFLFEAFQSPSIDIDYLSLEREIDMSKFIKLDLVGMFKYNKKFTKRKIIRFENENTYAYINKDAIEYVSLQFFDNLAYVILNLSSPLEKMQTFIAVLSAKEYLDLIQNIETENFF